MTWGKNKRNADDIGSLKPDSTSQRTASKRSKECEIGFTISVLGYGVVAMIGFWLLARPGHGHDPTLDGTEQFAKAIFHEIFGWLLAIVAMLASVATGIVGAYLGSNLGKSLLLLGCVSIAICLSGVLLYSF